MERMFKSSLSRHRYFRRAFSLVELLVVMAVICIMLLILLTIISKTYKVVKSFRSDAGPFQEHRARG
jgi:prepilin-type N-terminal cleavage/methylation domain-containing protein